MVDTIFCNNAGDTVVLPDPDDPKCGHISKGRYGYYSRVVTVIGVNGDCTITTKSGGTGSITGPNLPASASISLVGVCGFEALGQALTLAVVEGASYHVASTACVLSESTPPVPPVSPPLSPCDDYVPIYCAHYQCKCTTALAAVAFSSCSYSSYPYDACIRQCVNYCNGQSNGGPNNGHAISLRGTGLCWCCSGTSVSKQGLNLWNSYRSGC